MANKKAGKRHAPRKLKKPTNMDPLAKEEIENKSSQVACTEVFHETPSKKPRPTEGLKFALKTTLKLTPQVVGVKQEVLSVESPEKARIMEPNGPDTSRNLKVSQISARPKRAETKEEAAKKIEIKINDENLKNGRVQEASTSKMSSENVILPQEVDEATALQTRTKAKNLAKKTTKLSISALVPDSTSEVVKAEELEDDQNGEENCDEQGEEKSVASKGQRKRKLRIKKEKIMDTILIVDSRFPLTFVDKVEELAAKYIFVQFFNKKEAVHSCFFCKEPVTNLFEHYHTVHYVRPDIYPKTLAKEDPRGKKHQGNIDGISCHQCAERLHGLEQLFSHHNEKHGALLLPEEKGDQKEAKDRAYCTVCLDKFSSFESLCGHLKTAHYIEVHQCVYCKFSTADSSKLKRHTGTAHTRKKKIARKVPCPSCKQILEDSDDLIYHFLDNHTLVLWSDLQVCLLCCKFISTFDDLKAHLKNCRGSAYSAAKEEVNPPYEPSGNQSQSCFICKKSFESKYLISQHMHHVHMEWLKLDQFKGTGSMLEHNYSDVLLPLPADNKDQSVHILQNALDYLSSMNLWDSTGSIEKIGHYCEECRKVIQPYSVYYLHMFYHHGLRKTFTCMIPDCRTLFQGVDEYCRHSRHHDQSMTWFCSLCEEIFHSKEEREVHSYSLHHIKKFMSLERDELSHEGKHKCPTCNESFVFFKFLKEHLECCRHNYSCLYCHQKFDTSIKRRSHVEKTHHEKSLICEECGHEFENKDEIWDHLQFHGICHRCSDCGRRFSSIERLNVHAEGHWKVRKNCPECTDGKGFSSRLEYYTHYLFHFDPPRPTQNIMPFSEWVKNAKIDFKSNLHSILGQPDDDLDQMDPLSDCSEMPILEFNSHHNSGEMLDGPILHDGGVFVQEAMSTHFQQDGYIMHALNENS